MKEFKTKWWALTIPIDSIIETLRDHVAITIPNRCRMTLAILRGDVADTTNADLETYARPFENEMIERESMAENGWTGFTFIHQDVREGTRGYRGYFAKKHFLLILTINPQKESERYYRDMFVSTLRNLKIN